MLLTESTQHDEMLSAIVHRAQQLYSLPAVAMKVLELTNNPRIDAQALKDCIEKDPALTAKILRVVNSSLFGLSREVSDLNQALALLGTRPLKLLVLGFSLPDALFDDVATDALTFYWQHTLVKTVAAREISERLFHAAGDEAFIAGLLQDLGMLVLLQDIGKPYAKFLSRISHEGGETMALEVRTLGFHHVRVTAQLLDHWGLPAMLVEAVGTPHDVDVIQALPDDKRTLPQILHLAELLSQLLAKQHPGVLGRLLETGEQYCEMTMEQLGLLVDAMQQKVPDLCEVLSLNLPEHNDYNDVLRRAHRRCAELAGDVTELQEADPESPAVTDVESPPRHSQRLLPLVDTSTEAFQSPSSTATETFSDQELTDRLHRKLANCRQTRCPLSLLLIEIDDYEELIATRGLASAEHLIQILDQAASAVDNGSCSQLSDSCFAVTLEGCERHQAVEFSRKLVRGVFQWSQQQSDSLISVSAGVATVTIPSKNFPAEELIDAAKRCLYSAQSAGGNGVKSIDIY